MMRRRIAQLATLSLILMATMGSVLNNDAGRRSHSNVGAFGSQDDQARKGSQRCLSAPLPSCPRGGEVNDAPEVTLKISEQKIIQPCQSGTASQDCTPSETQQVQLQVLASDKNGDTLRYSYSTTGGRVKGEGPNVTWDLAGVKPGTYTATVEVDDMCGCVAFSSAMLTVASCDDCRSSAP